MGLIGNRLFAVFDKNQDNTLDKKEFVKGIGLLFSSSIIKKIDLIYEIYDSDKDNKITREDVRIILSHCPINSVNEDSFCIKAKEGLMNEYNF